MRAYSLFCTLIVLFLGGCAGHNQESSTDGDSVWPQQPWQIHCETQLTYALDFMALPGIYHGRWLWGLDTKGEEVLLDGHIEDGFFHLSRVRASNDELLPNNRAALRQVCLDTLRRTEQYESLSLGRVRAARSSADIDVPILFPEDSPGSDEVTQMVLFGDSLSDTGRLKHRVQLFPSDPYWLGRFSNGPAWPDYLEGSIGLSIQNLSYGGASVARADHLQDGGFVAFVRGGGQFYVSGSIAQQVEDYVNESLEAGQVSAPGKTVIVIWAGANDYISKEPITGLITTFLNSPDSEMGYTSVVDETIVGLAAQVRILHKAGARKILLINMPDLGTTPIVLQNTTYASDSKAASESERRFALSQRLSKLTYYHNKSLEKKVEQLNSELAGITVLLVDSQGLTNSILAGRSFLDNETAFDYGFAMESLTEELVSEEQRLMVPNRCYTGKYIGSVDLDNICQFSHRALFWDVVHPTSYAHCWQAYQVARELANAGWVRKMLEPVEYREWCQKFSGLLQ